MNYLKTVLFVTSSLFIVHFATFAQTFSCKSEKGTNIDWFINYKLPKLESYGDTLLGRGQSYAYLVSNSKIDYFRLSDRSIASPNSMVGRTLDQYYENSGNEKVTYLFYNDEPPDGKSFANGHTKGVVLFGEKSGFWLIHSVPKFPSYDSYEYPLNGFENGQSFLCVTFNVEELNEIGKQLLFYAPGTYANKLSDRISHLLDDDVKTLFSEKPIQIRSPPFSRIAMLKSKRKHKFTSFAKDNQFGKDLYGALIAPELDSNLFVESWRRGSGTPLDPTCGVKYNVEDVEVIGMSLKNKSKEYSIEFSSTEDHSKWAISEDAKSKWVCIGDINRMASQEKRGGGSLCFQSIKAWSAFSSAVVKTDQCK